MMIINSIFNATNTVSKEKSGEHNMNRNITYWAVMDVLQMKKNIQSGGMIIVTISVITSRPRSRLKRRESY